MPGRKRTIFIIAAGVGWGAAIGITLATPHITILREHPQLFTRLFLLCAMVAAVLTLGLWVERSLLPVVETVFKLGMRARDRMDRLDTPAATLQSSPRGTDWWWAQPVNDRGQQDTPPAGWLRR